VPFFVLLASLVLDAGISPLASRILEYRFLTVTDVAQPEEIPAAVMLIMVNAISIAIGMYVAWFLWDRVGPMRRPLQGLGYSTQICCRAWKASFAMFIFGALCSAIVFLFLLRDYSLLQLAIGRALFSAEEAVRNPFYNYARVLSSFMVIGAWGMLLFSARKRVQMRLAIMANLGVVLLQMIYGGRLKMITSLLAVAVLYHYGVRHIRFRNMIFLVFGTLIGLLGIQFLRFQSGGFGAAFLGITSDIILTTSINEAAFAIRMFPDEIPFIGWGVSVGSLSHLFPTLGDHIPWAENLWFTLVDYFFGGKNPMMGIGGEHYTPSAEHYMQFGLLGVVFFGVFFGVFYGYLFAWQKKQSRNLFILMFCTYFLISFFASLLDGRMAARLGGMGFEALLPIGILAAIVYTRRYSEIIVLGPLSLCAISFFLRRLFDLDIFDYTFAFALLFAYLVSLKFIGIANPRNERWLSRAPVKGWVSRGTF
jgi:oligosaccharide repeat unit polymerase